MRAGAHGPRQSFPSPRFAPICPGFASCWLSKQFVWGGNPKTPELEVNNETPLIYELNNPHTYYFTFGCNCADTRTAKKNSPRQQKQNERHIKNAWKMAGYRSGSKRLIGPPQNYIQGYPLGTRQKTKLNLEDSVLMTAWGNQLQPNQRGKREGPAPAPALTNIPMKNAGKLQILFEHMELN